MSDPRDYKLDIAGLDSKQSAPNAKARLYISVHFKCCGVYQRIYRNTEATAYEGRCPKCCRSVLFPVGPGGTDCRTFVVQ